MRQCHDDDARRAGVFEGGICGEKGRAGGDDVV